MGYFDSEAGTALKTAFDELVLSWPGVAAKTMFGCPSYTAEGTLFAVLVTDGVALTRLSDRERAAVDRSFDAGPFDAGGRTVTKWVQVTVGDASLPDSLHPYVEASYEAARAASTT